MKKLYFIICFVCSAIILMPYAFAYLDPSVMTYSIQIIAGVVVAAGAIVGIFIRRAKKKVQSKLGIDENTKKEVEDDIIEYSVASDENEQD